MSASARDLMGVLFHDHLQSTPRVFFIFISGGLISFTRWAVSLPPSTWLTLLFIITQSLFSIIVSYYICYSLSHEADDLGNSNDDDQDLTKSDGDDDLGKSDGDDDDDDDETPIKMTDLPVIVEARDPTTQLPRTCHLKMDLHVNVQKRQAIIKLYDSLIVEHTWYQKCPFFLFIYPENIEHLKRRKTQKGVTSIYLSMTQPPSFVVPDTRLPPLVKPRSKSLLDSLVAFASSLELTIIFNLNLSFEQRALLSAICPIWPELRLKSDTTNGSLQPLYNNRGGIVIRPHEIHIKGLLPPYLPFQSSDREQRYDSEPNPSATRKRRNETPEESLPPYPDDDGLRSPTPLKYLDRATRKRQRVSTDYNAEVYDQIRQLQNQVRQLQNQVGQLQNQVGQPHDCPPCRYDTDEEEAIRVRFHEEIEERVLEAEVSLEDKVLDNSEDVIDQKIEDRVGDLKAEIVTQFISGLEYVNRRNQR